MKHLEGLNATLDILRTQGLHEGLETLEKKHGIRSKQQCYDLGRLILLDYNQITVNWNEPYGYACRGLILSYEYADKFSVVNFCLPKFFNLSEGHASAIDWPSARVYEKLDGTMVCRWWNPFEYRFCYSTRFQLPSDLETNSPNGECTWRQLIDLCIGDTPEMFYGVQSSMECRAFECMSPINRIVVPHREFKSRLLARRDLASLQELPIDDYPAPKTFAFSNPEEVQAFADTLKGTDSEGFVVCDKDFNRIKIKGSQYVALHRMKDSLFNSFSSLVDFALSGDTEEVLIHFPEFKAPAERVLEALRALIVEHQEVYERLESIHNQKDFAIAVNATDLPLKSVLFLVRAKKQTDINEAIMNHRRPGLVEVLKERTGGIGKLLMEAT